MRHSLLSLSWTLTIVLAFWGRPASGQDSDVRPKAAPAAIPADVADVPAPPPNTWQRLSRQHDIWLDARKKQVIIDGEVCLREGQLELFACLTGTKEHESVVSLNCVAEQVHAALLAVGAEQGTPVSFDPKYTAATGDVIDVFVTWTDDKGKSHTGRAQDWVKYAKTGKAMEFDWVFAGSSFWTDEETGKKHYQANAGDLICVSNFPTALLDLPVESSQANASLLFVAFTENIPPRGTKVRVVLTPRIKREVKKPAEEEAAR
jgi:hypothetical protein